ncbi:MAG: CoA-binding protein [Acidobacteria bacterium]|nr:CoA-binding protein [Acidobacteriota bacterium]
MTERETVEDFLAQKRIAVIGVSRNPRDFTRGMFNEFVRRGYDAVPVNPNASSIDGRPCVSKVGELDPKPDAVLVMIPAAQSEAVARECAEAGIERIWFYRAVGHGAVDEKAVDLCESHGMRVVSGRCPFMFFPGAGFHGVHGWFLKLTGRYPR